MIHGNEALALFRVRRTLAVLPPEIVALAIENLSTEAVPGDWWSEHVAAPCGNKQG